MIPSKYKNYHDKVKQWIRNCSHAHGSFIQNLGFWEVVIENRQGFHAFPTIENLRINATEIYLRWKVLFDQTI